MFLRCDVNDLFSKVQVANKDIHFSSNVHTVTPGNKKMLAQTKVMFAFVTKVNYIASI